MKGAPGDDIIRLFRPVPLQQVSGPGFAVSVRPVACAGHGAAPTVRAAGRFSSFSVPAQGAYDQNDHSDQDQGDKNRSKITHDHIQHNITPIESVWMLPDTS